jgi:acetyl esterase/lipase
VRESNGKISGRMQMAILRTALLIIVVIIASALLFIHFTRSGVTAGTVVPLWTGDAPGNLGTSDADIPTISVFLPARWHASGAGMVICPGGAYKLLMSSYEGEDIARWLNSFGVAGFVLKYRIAPRYRYPAPLLDAQRAVRYVRYHSAEFGIRPDRIGIMGFSAGGHLASTVITHFQRDNHEASDAVDRVSSRPDFAILAYPIVTFRDPWTHQESVHNLLGPSPNPALIDELSNELHVTPDTPPTFLFHTGHDSPVPPENSLMFYAALRKAGVPAELHIYAEGPHGVGLANGHGKAFRVPSLLSWPLLAEEWLKAQWTPERRLSFSHLFRL